MSAHLMVYPTKASALNVKHPHGPKMAVGGVMWPKDSFTGRRLSDGSVTENEAKAYWPPEETSAAPSDPAPVSDPEPSRPAPAPAPAPPTAPTSVSKSATDD